MKHTLLIITAVMLVVGCSKNTVTDIDDNTYKTVQIGDQIWMAENLKVTHYRNGDPIPTGHSDSVWISLSTGAYAVYDGNESNADTYGYLYNWYAVNDSRNLAPEGWHVPTGDEWRTLVDYLGGKDVAGGKLKEEGTTHWDSPNTGATNETGFTALPGGMRYGEFYSPNNEGTGMNEYGCFWSSTERNEYNAWRWRVTHSSKMDVYPYATKVWGFSVRCIRD